MFKKYINKRKKFTTNTYMKEALMYDIFIFKEDDYFITVKKYNKVSDDFCISFSDKPVKYITNGYYVVEITPLNENYNIRYYLNNKREIIDYYIDITYENGVEYKIPYYVDLYLDIIHNPFDNSISFCDEDELKEALDNGIISKKDYVFAYTVGNILMEEIKSNKNKYLNIDISKYMKRVI